MNKKYTIVGYIALVMLLSACDKKQDDSASNNVHSNETPQVSSTPEPIKKLVLDTSNASLFHQKILNKYVPQQVAERVYVIHGPTEMPNPLNRGFMNNPGFIVGSDGVVVIDSGSSVQAGRSVIQRIKEVTDKPITHVFATHIHGDHWLGNHAIKEAFPDAKFYAHPKMIEMANNGEADFWINLMLELTNNQTEGTEAIIPDQILTDKQEIKAGDITIIVHLTGHAHTLTDVMYEIVEDKTLFTGDNITYKRIPRMTDGNFAGNIAAATLGLELPIEVVVPGHGPTGDKEVLRSYQNYLSVIYENAKVLMEEGLEPFEMKEAIIAKLPEYQDWPGMKDEVGKHISLAVTELEAASF